MSPTFIGLGDIIVNKLKQTTLETKQQTTPTVATAAFSLRALDLFDQSDSTFNASAPTRPREIR